MSIELSNSYPHLKLLQSPLLLILIRQLKTKFELYVGSIERSALSDWTKHDYKALIKKLYRWLNGGEDSVKVRWIKTTLKKHDRKLPEDMLNEEEVESMIDTTLNKRDKAIIALLWDIGARIRRKLEIYV